MTASTGENRAHAPGTDEPETYDDIPADTFALRLVMTRHHAGRLSIEKAAALCGLNPGNWAHWEDGRLPRDRPDTCYKIHRALRMDLQWLLYGGPLLGAHGRPAKRASKVNDDYRHTTRRMSITTERLLEPRPIVRGDQSAPIKTCVAGKRTYRVNPVPVADHPVHVINAA